MPILFSTKVAAATDILHTHINAIIDDIRSRHDHKDGRGYPIDHADLLESAAMDSVDHTHTNIQTHMMGSGSSFSDNPGGDEGVHGLSSGEHIVGTVQGDVVVIQAGRTAVSTLTGTIYFSHTFNTVHSIVVSGQTATTTYGEWDVRITGYGTTSFTYAMSQQFSHVHWIVVGN
jgi:hypothetical protein